jgi:hypothetical protein
MGEEPNMLKQYFLFVLILIGTIGFAFATPLTGDKIIFSGGGYDYTSFTAAINDLNANGVGAGGVTFIVAGTFYENPPPITASGTAANPVLFGRAEGWDAELIPTGGTGTYGFKLEGADYITFLDIDVTGSNTLVNGYWLAGTAPDGASHNTITSCTITVPYYYDYSFGIRSSSYSGALNHNNSYLNNTIIGSYYGISISGLTTGMLDQNTTVQGNNLTSMNHYGITCSYSQNTMISSNNIAFSDGGNSNYYGISIQDAPTTATVENNLITGGYTVFAVYGIYQAAGTVTYTNNTVSGLYNISNNTYNGIAIYGGIATLTGNTVSDITLTGDAVFYGIHGGGTEITLNNNTVSNIVSNTTATGIYLYEGVNSIHNNVISNMTTNGYLVGCSVYNESSASIYNNKIYNLTGIGTGIFGVYGISVYGGGTSLSIYNNFIYDLQSPNRVVSNFQIAGMLIGGWCPTVKVWNNTVFLNTSGTADNFSSTAFYLSNDYSTDLKNNIFVNKSVPGATGKTAAFWTILQGYTYLTLESDRNIYYAGIPDARHLIYYDGTSSYQTLEAYKTAVSQVDQNSYTEDVHFVSSVPAIDLHINPMIPTCVEGNAQVIPQVTTDIDGDLRNAATPDIGADEGDFIPVLPPLIGIKTINPAGGDYLSFTEAITDLNNRGVGTGGVTFMAAGVTYSETPPDITASGTASNPIMFTSMTITHPVITPSGAVLPNALCVMGGDYITFNNIDVEGPSNLFRAFELTALENNPVTHVTIQNCSIHYASVAGMFLAGIQTYSNVNAQNSYITIQNNTICNVTAGVVISYSYPENTSSNIIIQNNILTDINQYGIYVLNAINTSVTGNQISFMTAASNEIYGIITTGAASSVSIHNNAIYSGSSISDLRGITRESGNADIYANSITSLSFVATNGSYAFKLMEGSGTCNDNLVAGLVNSGTDEFHGYFVTQGTNTLSGNEIRNVSSAGIRTIGINVSGGTNTIKNNNIHQLNYYAGAGGQVTGIKIYGGTSHNVYNNLIYDLQNPNGTDGLQIVGIKLLTSSAINVWHNTVYLDAISNYPTFYTVAFLIDSGNELDPVLVKNNIFVNCSSTNTNGCAIAYGQTSELTPNIAPGSDNNIYYAGIPDDYHLIAYMGGNTYPTLDGYKIAAGTVDQNSYTENVPFISAVYPYNLHVSSTIPTAVESHGISIPEVTTDMDGDPRNALTPDIGADEGNFISTDLPPAVPDVTIHYTNGATPFVWLSWNAVTGATWYNVYVSAVPSDDMTDYTYIGGTTGTNWPDMGEIESWKFYKVTSEN